MQNDTKPDQHRSSRRAFGRFGRAIAMMLMAVTITGAVVTVSASPAAADARGCTPAIEIGLVCGHVYGDGLHVESVFVGRSRPNGGSVCNYTAVATVYDSGGSRIYQKQGPRVSGCTLLSGWIDFDINRYFPHNSKISLSFYESNVRQGTVSHRITR